jgi:hypothetical protein
MRVESSDLTERPPECPTLTVQAQSAKWITYGLEVRFRVRVRVRVGVRVRVRVRVRARVRVRVRVRGKVYEGVIVCGTDNRD